MATNYKINLCPFCGGEGKLVSFDKSYWAVICIRCGAEGSGEHFSENKSDNEESQIRALKSWNHRLEAKFKPCPFCQETVVNVIQDGKMYLAQCDSCFATGARARGEPGAIKKWNQRIVLRRS